MNKEQQEKNFSGVENHFHAPVTNYNAPVTNYNCVGCTLNFGGDMDRAFMRDHLPIKIEGLEECDEEPEQMETIDEEDDVKKIEEMFPTLFREELNLDAVVKEMKDIAYLPDYPVPYLSGIGRWYVFFKFFRENNLIEGKYGKQKMFQEFIERVFGWPQETKDFSRIIPSYYIKYPIADWPFDDRYSAMADHIRECFTETSGGRKRLKDKFLIEGRYIDIARNTYKKKPII